MRNLILALAVFFIAGSTYAAAPPDQKIDPGIQQWFHGLEDAQGDLCCNIADCRVVGYTPDSDGVTYHITLHEWVFPDGSKLLLDRTIDVTGDIIRPVKDNPTSGGVLCMRIFLDKRKPNVMMLMPMCFIPGRDI